MATKRSRSSVSNSEQGDTYIYADDSVHTLKNHASRTATTHANWFTPYLKPGMDLLDCGCASGSITVGFVDLVAPGQVIGIDLSETEIERARKRAAEANTSSIQFAQGDLYRLDFPDASFDALFCHNVLEHLSEPHKAMQQMYRVLKPGGVIGVRDIDTGGSLLTPHDDVIDRSVDVYIADAQAAGGDLEIGRRLGSMLLATGFVDIRVSASYEVYGSREERQFQAQLMADRFGEADFMTRLVRAGMADTEELKAMQAAWLTWRDSPGALLALAHVEAVGRKP